MVRPSSIALLLLTVPSTAGYKCLFIGHSFFAPIAKRLPGLAASAAGVTHEQSVVSSGGESGTPSRLWENPQKRNQIQTILNVGDIELFGMTLDRSSYEANTTEGYEVWFDYALSKNPSTMFMIGAPWPDFPRDYNTTTYTAIVREKYLPTLDGTFASLRAKYPGVTIIENPYALAVVEARLLYEAGGVPDVGSLFGGCAEDVTGESPCGDAFFTDYKGHGGEFLQNLATLVWLNRIYNVDLSVYNSSALSNFTTNMPAVAKAVLDAYDADNYCGTSTCSTCNVTTPCGVPPVIEPTGCPGDCHVYVTLTIARTMDAVTPGFLERICGMVAQAAELEADAATCTVREGDDAGSVFIDATLDTFIPGSGQTAQSVMRKLNRAINRATLPRWILDITVDTTSPSPPPPPPSHSPPLYSSLPSPMPPPSPPSPSPTSMDTPMPPPSPPSPSPKSEDTPMPPPLPPPPPARAAFNCYTGEVWSDEKSMWCCRHKRLGCPAPPPCKKTRPICTKEYRPVCGPDGKTYSNRCFAKAACQLDGSTPGECRCKKTRPICTKEYQPVCGPDGKTYNNRCIAKAACQLDGSTPGPCTSSPSPPPSPSPCKPKRGVLCPMNYEPVCGPDGKTYSNKCFAKAACQLVGSTPGPCTSPSPSPPPSPSPSPSPCKPDPEAMCPMNYDPVCGPDGVTYGNKCKAKKKCQLDGSTPGECRCKKTRPICTKEYQPVCGPDGKTYSNKCFAKAACQFEGSTPGPCTSSPSPPPSPAPTCKPRRGVLCPENYDPVCGPDGKTYSNWCFARAACQLVGSTPGPC